MKYNFDFNAFFFGQSRSKKYSYCYDYITRKYQFLIPKNAKILLIGCKKAQIFNALKPCFAVCITQNDQEVFSLQERYPAYHFYASMSDIHEQIHFDYIVLDADVIQTQNVQKLLYTIRKHCSPATRIIFETYSPLWEPFLWAKQKIGFHEKSIIKNWISLTDVKNFLHLCNFYPIVTGRSLLIPLYIPLISWLFNSILGNLPGINSFCMFSWVIARPMLDAHVSPVSVSVIIPCKNECGNIENIVKTCPMMGNDTQLIFIEGHSSDGTLQEIKRVAQLYPHKKISWFKQKGQGKADAVREGFSHAQGEILMILDADLTVAAEELLYFFNTLIEGKGELINGNRLVYGMESGAMRFLNLLANYFFGITFSWILGQSIKDTLCGTKVLYKRDYERIALNRAYFGNFDPFGDFDLLFGAAKLNLQIIDIPVQYKNRVYGSTQIRRFYHGFLLLKMSLFALKKFKFH